jgi:structural maintenance of chromosomes protein 5
MPSTESVEPRQYAKGAIMRIQMHNFLVYRDVTVPVGPRLNLVLGPNGTGKSSIVCALALALSGSPKILGRADNLAEFVMHEKDDAWVEVELYVPGGKFIVRREFSRKNKSGSKYSLNGRSQPEKDIKSRVLALGVQVENLCTFLPQDRVGDFSGYNPKQILSETCKAVEEEALYAKHLELIEADKSCVGREGLEQKVGDQLKQARATNDGLQRDVERMAQRATLLERMRLIKLRKLWISFNEARNETLVVKQQKEAKEVSCVASAALSLCSFACTRRRGALSIHRIVAWQLASLRFQSLLLIYATNTMARCSQACVVQTCMTHAHTHYTTERAC